MNSKEAMKNPVNDAFADFNEEYHAMPFEARKWDSWMDNSLPASATPTIDDGMESNMMLETSNAMKNE